MDITIKPLADLYQHYAKTNTLPPADAIHEALTLVDYRKIIVHGRRASLAFTGMGVTLDGIAKGYTVDAGLHVPRQHGFGQVLVEAGGDLLASGQKGPLTPGRSVSGRRAPRRLGCSLASPLNTEQ